MPGRLSVGEVVVGALMVPWWNRRAFARALEIPLAILFAVTTHRLVLLDAPVVAEKVAPGWSWRETRFFGCLVLTGAI